MPLNKKYLKHKRANVLAKPTSALPNVLRPLKDSMCILVNGESLFPSLSCHTFKFNINFEKCNKQKSGLASDHRRKAETYLPPCSTKKIGRLENFHWVKKPKKIPVVFTRDEAKKILLHLRGKEWLVSSLLFGSGLRLMEVLTLHVKDLGIRVV